VRKRKEKEEERRHEPDKDEPPKQNIPVEKKMCFIHVSQKVKLLLLSLGEGW